VRKETVLFLLIGILALPFTSRAQDDKPSIPLEKFYVERKHHPLRWLFKNLRFSASSGFGTTYFKHTLDGFGIYQSPTEGPYIFAGSGVPTSGHSQWIDTNTPTPITVAGGDFLITSETAKIGFKSKSFTIPIKLTVHYEFKNFRVGAGFDNDFIFMKPFSPISYTSQIGKAEANSSSVSATKFFGLAGYSFYRIQQYVFTGDVQFGTNKFGKNFDRSVIKPSGFFNLGITVERELSEYFKVFARPSFEFKSYTLSLAESNLTIKHKANSFMLFNVGFTYTVPDLPRCKLKECRIQINHAHGNKEYRSRVHPIYKKQNPGYGENNPTLIKYKWRNRNKTHPY